MDRRCGARAPGESAPHGGAGVLRLVFAGTPEPAARALAAILASGHEVVAVLTRPDAPTGRGRRTAASPVSELAAEHGITVLTPRRLRDPDALDALRALRPECCPVVAYGALVPAEALAVPSRGWVNLHYSLLPAWRGAAPVHHAVRAGDEITGTSTFRLDEGLDTGPVYGTTTEEVRPEDTTGSLLDRLATSGAQLLVATLDGIADASLAPVPQPAEGVSLAPKLSVDDARIDFAVPAIAVDRQIRACTPAPGPWTTLRGRRIKLGPVATGFARTDGHDGPLGPGEIQAGRRDVLVGTASDPVRLSTVQPPGRRPVPAADWARGARLAPAEVLGADG